MEVRVSIEKRHIAYLVVSLLILSGVNYAIAYGGDQPSVVGHNADEIGEGTIAGILNITGDKVVILGTIQIVGGDPSADRVLTAQGVGGVAQWQAPPSCRICKSCGGSWPTDHGRWRANGVWDARNIGCSGSWTDTGSPDVHLCCSS